MPRRYSEQELQQIYAETIDDLYRFVSRRCGSQRSLAEDITQEAWLRAVSAWYRDGLPNNPIAWLQTVARNLILNHQRRQASVPIDLLSAHDTLATADYQSGGDSAETAAIVAAALMRLSREDAQLLESFHYDGSRMSQLAVRYGISESAVDGRLRRARERLRRELENILRGERGLA